MFFEIFLCQDLWVEKKFIRYYTLPSDLQDTPILYLYGKNKNCMFHSTESLTMLEQGGDHIHKKTKAIGLEKAGHYLFTKIQEENVACEAIEQFISTSSL